MFSALHIKSQFRFGLYFINIRIECLEGEFTDVMFAVGFFGIF